MSLWSFLGQRIILYYYYRMTVSKESHKHKTAVNENNNGVAELTA